jgi:hypothetical protein
MLLAGSHVVMCASASSSGTDTWKAQLRYGLRWGRVRRVAHLLMQEIVPWLTPDGCPTVPLQAAARKAAAKAAQLVRQVQQVAEPAAQAGAGDVQRWLSGVQRQARRWRQEQSVVRLAPGLLPAGLLAW